MVRVRTRFAVVATLPAGLIAERAKEALDTFREINVVGELARWAEHASLRRVEKIDKRRTRGTVATVAADGARARATGTTRIRCANVDFATRSDVPGHARTGKRPGLIDTRSVVEAGVARAFVDVRLAEYTAVTCQAMADKAIERVETRTSVHAWRRGAFIDVSLAQRPDKASVAFAKEPSL